MPPYIYTHYFLNELKLKHSCNFYLYNFIAIIVNKKIAVIKKIICYFIFYSSQIIYCTTNIKHFK